MLSDWNPSQYKWRKLTGWLFTSTIMVGQTVIALDRRRIWTGTAPYRDTVPVCFADGHTLKICWVVFFFASDRVETFMLLQKKISVDVNFKVIKEYVQIKNVNLSKSRWFFKIFLLCKHSNVCFLLLYNIMIITVTHLIKEWSMIC